MRDKWSDRALKDIEYWQAYDPKIAARIDILIADIKITLFTGLGKPEPLRHDRSGWWSRRITGEHRLVYRVHKGTLEIAQCRYHY